MNENRTKIQISNRARIYRACKAQTVRSRQIYCDMLIEVKTKDQQLWIACFESQLNLLLAVKSQRMSDRRFRVYAYQATALKNGRRQTGQGKERWQFCLQAVTLIKRHGSQSLALRIVFLSLSQTVARYGT